MDGLVWVGVGLGGWMVNSTALQGYAEEAVVNGCVTVYKTHSANKNTDLTRTTRKEKS